MSNRAIHVQTELELSVVASLVKFLELSHTFAIDSTLFTEQEARDVCSGYLSLRDQLDEFKRHE
ncbi:hypothetical protein P4S60_10485 [Pseudoalteromonas sp. Hal040]|uniref:hypothetical protein n=1 Tax=unclassified Pseudoalteromonas TaxID=194690 RepID=UPI00301C487B